MVINIEKLRTPKWIFIIYMLVSCLLIMLIRYIFPGSVSPLIIFSHEWRLLQGGLTIFSFFPALVFSSLVTPFGLVSYESDYQSFSNIFNTRLVSSVMIAIISAVLYAVIFFLALPLAKNYERNLIYKGELYTLAKEQAQIRSRAGDWMEASQFIGICDQVWHNSPELASLRLEVEYNLQRIISAENYERYIARTALANREYNNADISTLHGQQQLDTLQALALGEAAFREERYFDSHWLAVLAGRLAPIGSPEAVNAARLASEAWNSIASLEPNRRDVHLLSLYEMKISGYQAMNSGDWIRAYYIFMELFALTPDDPDVKNFIEASRRALEEYAFFIDEIELSLGEILTGAIFSLPTQGGRAVARFSSLSTSADVAYGMGFEYMEFDIYSRPIISMRAPYAKLLPVTLNNRSQVMIITHALNRYDRNIFWDTEWLLGENSFSGVIIDKSYEDFLLLSGIRQGLPNLQIDELFLASKRLGSAGYVSEIFEAELLNRFGTAMFFLPMAIFVIVMAWRYRAKTKPRYFFFLLLPVLPVVFHGFVFIYRSLINTLGIWLVLSLGFSAAIVLFIVSMALLLFASMMVLASQHG